MAFKATVQNQRLAHFVASSALGLAEQVRDVVSGKLAAFLLEGEVLPDVKLFQELIGRLLKSRGAQLLEADDRYTSDQVVARDLELRRGELTRQLRLALGDARHFFNRQLGRERSEAFLPKRTFSRLGAAELIRHASQAAGLLREPERSAERIPGVASPIELADQLAALATQLQEVLDLKEGLQARQKQVGLAKKSAELAEAGQTIRNAAGLLTGLYTFADLPFHAQRVRRRVNNRKGQVPEEGEGEEMLPGGGSPSPAQEVILPVA